MKHVFSFFILAFLVSCQSNDNNETIDLVNVVRDGATIPAYIYGNTGSDIFTIILHGGPGGSGLEYRGGAFMEELERRYGVVYTEQRGQGMSQGNLEINEFTPENLAKDVHALAKTLRLKYGQNISLFLLGHSWGGTLGSTVMINEEFSKEYNGWIEVAGAHDLPLSFTGGLTKMDSIAEEQIKLQSDTTYWKQLQTKVRNIDTTLVDNHDGILEQNMLAFEAESRLTTNGFIDELSSDVVLSALTNGYFINNSITTFFTGNTTNSAFFENGLNTFSNTEKLSNITTPTLLMWGKYDMVVTDELGFSALEKIGTEDKALHIFERSGHAPFLNEPTIFTDIVVEFIERLK